MKIIRPKNWAEFQHYKDRSPQWVKLHKRLLDDFEYQTLPVASRALAPMLWLLASEYDDGDIPSDTRKIAFRLRMTLDELSVGFEPLLRRGFFEIIGEDDEDASNTLAEPEPVASLEKEIQVTSKTQVQGEKKRASARPVVSPEPLPSWVPKEAWEGFVRMRSHIKAPLTDNAKTLTLRDLSRLRDAGHDPQAVLEESVKNSWRGLFPPKDKTDAKRGRTSRIDNAIAGAHRFLGEADGVEESGASPGKSARSGEVFSPSAGRAIGHQKAIGESPPGLGDDLSGEGFDRGAIDGAVSTILRRTAAADSTSGGPRIQAISGEPIRVYADTGPDFGAVQAVKRVAQA